MNTRRQLGCLSLLLVTLASAASAGPESSFTSIGGAAVVDVSERSNLLLLPAGVAQLSKSAPASSSIRLRYNVVALEGLVQAFDGYTLSARLRDTGGGSRVFTRLMEYDIATGAIVCRMELDSDSVAPAATFQTQSVTSCDPAWSLDFEHKAYFIEVLLHKFDATSSPGLAVVQLAPASCP